MVKEVNEIDVIWEHIEKGDNFLLSGGAGSGKTYSLVKVISRIFENDPRATVRCITFTNVAVDEIRSRLDYQNLQVSTIHDFLWECIKLYQKNLKACLLSLINNDVIKHSFNDKLPPEFFSQVSIEYKEWTKLAEAIISHDEVICLSREMFSRYPLLTRIVKDKFDFILIDEYQDTSPDVIAILLDCLPTEGKSCIIGLFGDAMQSIYEGSIGNVQAYVQSGKVKEVIKKDNRRNPGEVIVLANQLRKDTVTQQAANDVNAPNYQCQGTIRFFYSDNPALDNLKQHKYFHEWNFQNIAQTKELYLTHNLIASKAQFISLIEIYDKDRVIEYKRVLQKIVREQQIPVDGLTFGEVMDQLNQKPSKMQQEFFIAHPELLEQARRFPWEVFEKIYLEKEQLIGTKKGNHEEQLKKGTQRDALINHLYGLQGCLHLYNSGQYRQLVQKNHMTVDSIKAKQELKAKIERLNGMMKDTIEEVIEAAHESGVFYKSEKLLQFVAEKTYVYNRVKTLPYQQFVNLYQYIEGYTPFSTQHNVKGAEFDNVLVILDNGKWNNYNFENLFLENGSSSVLERTRKIFYVCCTRAKKNLAVFYHSPKPAVVEKAKVLFGVENVEEL